MGKTRQLFLLPITYHPSPASLVSPFSSDKHLQEGFMKTEKLKEVVRVLMSSRFYFELDTRERYKLVVHVLAMMESGAHA